MATRDLTKEFLEFRATAVRKRHKPTASSPGGLRNNSNNNNDSGGSYKMLAAGGAAHDLMLTANNHDNDGGEDSSSMEQGRSSSKLSHTAAVATAPPSWVSDVASIESCLTTIATYTKDLQGMHAQRINSVFGRDLDHREEAIEEKTARVTDLFRQAERLLQRVGMATRHAGGQEATVGANVQRSLAKRLQEQSVAFRHSQRRYLAEVQTQKSGGLAPEATLKFGIQFDSNSNGKSSSNTQSTSYINDNNSGNGFATSALVNDGFFATSQSQQVVLDDPLTIAVQSRDVEIIKIAQSIEELGSIFKELAVLVIDQGTILDRIDYNMEAVVEHTQTGIAQLEKAEKSQKNARPLRCIVCLSMTIFVLLTLLIIKHRPRRGWF